MADAPFIVSQDNVKDLTDYYDLQQKIQDTLKKNLEIIDKISHIDRNLQVELEEKVETQREYLKDIDKLQIQLQKQLELQREGVGANDEALASQIAATKTQIKDHLDLIGSLQKQVSHQMNMAVSRYEEENKYQTLVTGLFSKVTGFQNKQLSKHKEIYKILNKSTYGLKEFAGVFAGILVIATHAFEVFKQFDKAAADFRISMGFTRAESVGLKGIAEKIAIDFQHVGVNINRAYDAIRALGKELGSSYLITSAMVKNVAILSSQLGVAADDSAGFMRNLAAISKSTMQTQQDMGYTAAWMTQASGVPLAQVMNDVAKATNVTLTMMSRVPNQVLRSAIELRRMGSSLNEAAEASNSILDFTNSMNNEMEASVLLGRGINLQKARELAYHRDLEGSTKEILRLTKSVNFVNLDKFQMDAFAKATGRSVEELLKMVQVDKQWSEARRSQDPELKKMVANYDAMRNASKLTVQSETDKLKLMVQTAANQDRLTSITNKWNQILTKASAVFLPIIDVLLSAVIPVMDIAQGVFGILVAARAIGATMMVIGGGIDIVLSYVFKAFTFFEKIALVGEDILGFVGSIGSKLGGIIKWALPFAGMFGDAIPILGEVIMALQFIYGFFKGFSQTSGGFWAKIWGGLKGGLMEIVGPLLDLLKWPFNKFLSWFGLGPLAGHSPSELGLSILKGIMSVGGMLFDALTSPFRHALAWIADKIPGMGKVAEKLRGGVNGLMNQPLETKVSASYIPAVQVTPNGTRIATNPDAKPVTTSDTTKESTRSLDDIFDMLKQLNDNLTSGKVKAGDVYLNASLVSSVMSRELSFNGNYGTNR